ncbi:MAG: helix-turn-helix transcriptional regulator [Saprospiraceae bacterium]|nr:helix-turn-helix transcriptional regulator [Saprospiraceae bacterium]
MVEEMQTVLKNERVEVLVLNKMGRVKIAHFEVILTFNLDGTVSDGNGFSIFSTSFQGIINSIINCSFAGQAQAFFLEAKALELAALYLAATEQTTKNYVFCKSEYDRERLFFAKTYLLEHYDLPPTIAELARIAGINEFKLKNGFKELFGDTIHNFVNNHKMDIALKRLTEGGQKASQVAFDLGFSSLQHFSKAFRQKFGYPPSQVKKDEKLTGY